MAAGGCVREEVIAARAAAFAVLDRRLDPASAAPLALGLSGGGDSVALLRLTVDWARTAGRRVLALTVDHGLHPESARWTAEAGAMARALGADWRPLAWTGHKPATGLPAAARRARHALLAEAARAAGAAVVLLGHTADDVDESDLIRRETPGHGRLRDWAPSPVWPEGRGVFLLRPLLDVRRPTLREMLSTAGLQWLEDPANADPRFARARVRRQASCAPTPDVPGGGRGPEHHPFARYPEPGPRPSPGCADVEGQDHLSAHGIGSVGKSGGLVLDRVGAIATPDVLARAVVCAAGQERRPSANALARLVEALNAASGAAATLAGAKVVIGRDTVTLCRELGRRPPTLMALSPGERRVFDGRFEIVAEVGGWRVAPLSGRAARLPPADRRRLGEVPAVVRPSLPVLLGPEGQVRLPRPFGDGPAEARELVGMRLTAALGRIGDERALAAVSREDAVYGA